jgi:hypothetical protein
MLDLVIATRFDRRVGSGKTWPCLLSCTKADGDEVEVVAKFSAGCERQVGGLVAEAIAAMLAADLDLPVPEPLLVEFDAEFVELIRLRDPALAERAGRSVPVAFGSTKLPPGFAVLPRGKSVPQTLRPLAVEIFAFDALIQNPDRRPENPNCLLDGRSFAIFDHELAFVMRGIIDWRPPWEPSGLEMIKGPNRHVFFSDLQGKAADFSRLRGAWQAVSDARLQEYRQALPGAWRDSRAIADEILDYVAKVRDNIDPALTEIARVIA